MSGNAIVYLFFCFGVIRFDYFNLLTLKFTLWFIFAFADKSIY
jgi:hypothetical protein